MAVFPIGLLKWQHLCGLCLSVQLADLSVVAQGFELKQGLKDQEANDALLKSGTESYFSEYGGFKSVKSQPRV